MIVAINDITVNVIGLVYSDMVTGQKKLGQKLHTQMPLYFYVKWTEATTEII